MRLIDADALMQALGITNMDCDKCAWHDKEWNRCKRGGNFEDACYAIENAPTVEPERKKGKWIRTDMTDIVYEERIGWAKWNCSECGIEKKIGWAKGVNFCPNCGADMR